MCLNYPASCIKIYLFTMLEMAVKAEAMRPVVISYITLSRWHHSHELTSPFIGVGTLPLNVLHGFRWLGISPTRIYKLFRWETNRWLRRGLSSITSPSLESVLSYMIFYVLPVELVEFLQHRRGRENAKPNLFLTSKIIHNFGNLSFSNYGYLARL